MEAVGLVIEVVRDRGLHLALQDVLVWVPATLDSDAIRDEVVLEIRSVRCQEFRGVLRGQHLLPVGKLFGEVLLWRASKQSSCLCSLRQDALS